MTLACFLLWSIQTKCIQRLNVIKQLICDKTIKSKIFYLIYDRRRLLDSTYLTRVNVLKFANLFQSRNKIKLRHLCKFIKIISSKTRPPG
jgi:hypothetical protein